MSPRGLLLCLSLLGIIAGGASKPQYALSIPALLKSGETATACINFVGLTESLSLKVNVEVSGVNTTIFTDDITENEIFKCKTFEVPNVEQTSPVFLTMEATGATSSIVERRSVVIDKMETIHIIQLDKPIYKRGQKVMARLISLNSQLRPVPETYTLIYLKDPYGSRLKQWENVVSVRGVGAFNFVLLPDASLGGYTVIAEKKSGGSISQVFDVEEYVLPRFSVTVDAPNTISILDQTTSISVQAKYTYGRSVPGKISGRLCRKYSSYYPGNNCNRNPEGLCSPISGEMDSDGKFSNNIDLSLFHLDRSGFSMGLNIDATVIEDGTGVQVKESRSISVTSQIARVTFDNKVMLPFYKQGIPYSVSMTLVDALGKPIKNETIELRLAGNFLQNLTTDSAGKATYEIDTSKYEQIQLDIQANYKNTETCYDSNWVMPSYSNAYYSAMRFYSRTGSHVQLNAPQQELSCGKGQSLQVYYSLSKEGLGEKGNTISFYYMVMSKVKIVDFGSRSVDVSSSQRGSFSFDVPVSSELAPGADVVVYSILESEVIASTARLNVQKCFQNNVSMSFSEAEGMPGSKIMLKLKADAKSLCGLRIIDSSLLLLNQNGQLTADMVYNSLRYLSLNGYNVRKYNVEPPKPPCIDPSQRVRMNGLFYEPVNFPGEGYTYNDFKSIGLIFATNVSLHKPEVCGGDVWGGGRPFITMERTMERFSSVADGPGTGLPAPIASPVASPVATVRKFFPEVWRFDLVNVDITGSLSIPEKAPDTITQWQGSMFCVSEKTGFGLTKYPSNFTTFLPLFLELSLPYSFTRGETLVLRAFVSNYLNQCVKVRVTLKRSADYTATLQEGKQNACLCPRERASYSWNVNAKSLGVITFTMTAQTTHIGATCEGRKDTTQPPRSDTVIQTIIVEAEGIEKEITYSNLVCVEGEKSVIPISISPPPNAVAGSVQGSVTVMGDLLGHAVNNPDSLIQLPTGCGEQNLVKLMPIPSVLGYLNCTGQLTKEIKDKALQYMDIGYMRQLGYKRQDGTFSAFGQSDREGSSWLTALTFNTFEEIKSYTLVDPAVQNQALLALAKMQDLKSGCFKATGNLFHNGLKGGADNEISFTSYVAAMLFHTTYPAAQTLLRGALGCLDEASRREQSLYNLALMFNAFALSENLERRNYILAQLKSKAIQKDGSIHWERTDKPKAEMYPFFYAPAPSAEIEITGYILMGMTYGPTPSQDDKSYMAQIVLWLCQQQNSQGGYRSTADTVVALHALARYSCLVYKEGATNQIQVTSGKTVIANFNVLPKNRLLVQKKPLPKIPGNYGLEINGKGCCLVQCSVRYNVPVIKGNSAFSLSVESDRKSCIDGVAYTMPITMSLSYNGNKNQSNMAVIIVKLLSGYTPEYQSVQKLRKTVSKVEQNNNRLVIYLESVSIKPITLSVTLEMNNRVQNFQPQFVYVFDYYEADENGVAELKHSCAA
ncbi:ovostatin [Xenopus laevis]|uniref:Ovostatin n=1 Tax=Xenopus laevis TaxID=8355 RepID=A0A8J1L9B5_XENLA|nr:ovostatin [Xenopus laevis]